MLVRRSVHLRRCSRSSDPCLNFPDLRPSDSQILRQPNLATGTNDRVGTELCIESMEALSAVEEERKLRELQDLHDSILLDDTYFSSRNLSGKGRIVTPSAKQRRDVQVNASVLRFSTLRPRGNSSANAAEDNSIQDSEDQMLSELDLTAKPRTFVGSGPLTQYDPDKLLRKSQKRYAFLFSDLLVITLPKDSQDFYDVQQVLYIKDLRLRYGADDADDLSFELVVVKTRHRPQQEFRFRAEEPHIFRQWIEDLENTMLAFFRQTEFARTLGWFHEIIQGNIYSAAYLGDVALLRKHIKRIADPTPISGRQPLKRSASAPANALPSTPSRGGSTTTPVPITPDAQARSKGAGSSAPSPPASLDAPDLAGMTALHWCVLRGHEISARLLLDRGAEVDVLQKGLNTPLLLACAGGHENIARLLIERGAELHAQNHRGYDAVFMAALCGHAAKGLPWLLQLLHAKGLDLNAYDRSGATPLHLCAERNLARPVRMLVDAGAEVNVRHASAALTPLQMACSSRYPDVETIRSFLDKGAYPNWRDLQGRSAFDLALRSLPPSSSQASGASSPSPVGNAGGVVFSSPSAAQQDLDQLLSPASSFTEVTKGTSETQESTTPGGNERWRAMEATLQVVGDWVVRTLPALLELSKKGARFETTQLQALRPSVRAAVLEAREVWEKKVEPDNFLAFVRTREASGEDLKLHRKGWSKDDTSSICQLCSDAFGITNRRHHCRACGVLVCDRCSGKRLRLSAAMLYSGDDPRASFSSPGSATKDRGGRSGKEDQGVRVCDGCFNRLLHEAALPSLDHFRVRQLKKSAQDVLQSLAALVEDLDMAEAALAGGLPPAPPLTPQTPQPAGNGAGFRSPQKRSSLSPMPGGGGGGGGGVTTPLPRAGGVDEDAVERLRVRQAKLLASEHVVATFLDAAHEYHKTAKKLLDSRMWGHR